MPLVNSLGTTSELAALFSDGSVLAAMAEFEAALGRAQERLGILPRGSADWDGVAGAGGELDAAAVAREARDSATMAIPFLAELRRRVPDAADAIHFGA